MTTEGSPLRAWLAAPAPGRGIHLAGDDGGWTFHEYAELASASRRVAAALVADGVRPGDVVCAILPSGFRCLSTLFGAWTAGATISLVPPPAFNDEQAYVDATAHILTQATPRLTVTSPDLEPLVARALAAAGRPEPPWRWRQAAAEADPSTPSELAVLQFTSGSGRAPRGVQITWDNLAANIELLRGWVDPRGAQTWSSWLPLYHDLGLIIGMLCPVTLQRDLWLMRPHQFIRDPGRWLETLAAATVTAAPPFGYAYATQRVPPERLAGLDLSGVRCAFVGAEPIDVGILAEFTRLASTAGFSPLAFMPGYGLAESTVAVTVHAGSAPVRAVLSDSAALRLGEPVRILAERELTAGDRPAGESWRDVPGWIVGCGAAGAGGQVDVVDEDGRPLPADHLGEVVVGGPSVTPGYRGGTAGDGVAGGGTAGDGTRFRGGLLYTGDAGFLHRGELYVLGRMGDSLKVRGRPVYVEDLEAKILARTRLGPNRAVVVGASDTATPRVALFAEAAEGPWVADAVQTLRGELGPDVDVSVVVGQRGLIRRTTSGKPRRRHMWQQLVTGQLPRARVLRGPSGLVLSAEEIEHLLGETLPLVDLPDGAAVVLEGSVAEGFGNAGSDIDFLIVAPGDAELPTMPSLLFVGGRRVEVRSRSLRQLIEACARVAAGRRRAASLPEDLLNRCQRLLHCVPLRQPELLADVHRILPVATFREVMTAWWAHYARQSLRHAVAMSLLGEPAEAVGWAREGLAQAAKSWAARHGETYLEPKWLSMQLERAGRPEVTDRYWALEPGPSADVDAGAYVTACLRFAAELGVSGLTPTQAPARTPIQAPNQPDQLTVARVPGVTTWPVGTVVHVIRGRDVFALGPVAGRVWRCVVFGRPLPAVLAKARAAGVADPGPLMAHFLRLGLARLEWSDGVTVAPELPLAPPATGGVTPPPSTAAPLLTIGGARVSAEDAVDLLPLPADRFGAVGMAMFWCNMIVENAKEDFRGAIANGQWRVAELCARRILRCCLRGVLTAYGVHPLPADSDLVHRLALLPRGAEEVVAGARRLETVTVASREQALAADAELERYAALVRDVMGSASFPSSFDSSDAWRTTLEIAYDWLRLGAYLDADMPIDEARDLVSSGGAQPHLVGAAPADDTTGSRR